MAIDVQSLFFVLLDQLMPIAEWLRVVGECAVEGLAVGCYEANGAVVEYQDDDVAFVDLAVVEAAQAHQIGKLRFAAMSPMFDVMAVEVPSIRAARESTAAFIA